MQKKLLLAALAATFGMSATASYAASHGAGTLQAVMDKGFVQCGVPGGGTKGFGAPDENNQWSGLEVDFCRALSAAIFDDADAVRYTPLTSTERFAALSSGEIDVLSRTTTWTMTRDTSLGINFVGVMFYDGQGFMVRKADGISSALELDGASVCIESGTTTELNAADYFSANNISVNTVVFESQSEVVKAYDDGRCDVFTTDASALAANRLELNNPNDHVILSEIISKEPLGPSVRQGDDAWFNLNRWVYFLLLNAEELGVTQANVDEMLASDNPGIKRLLGVEGNYGELIGVSNDWGYRIIKALGNYGEMYERHVGPNTEIGIARGVNALWTDGGIQYAPPVR